MSERTNALTKTLKSRETALARAEEKIAALTERNGHLEADIQVSRTNIEKRVEDLNSALQRERMERAVVEGALEAARKDNSRLQSEVAALRSTAAARRAAGRCAGGARRGRNDETPPKGKRQRPVEKAEGRSMQGIERGKAPRFIAVPAPLTYAEPVPICRLCVSSMSLCLCLPCWHFRSGSPPSLGCASAAGNPDLWLVRHRRRRAIFPAGRLGA